MNEQEKILNQFQNSIGDMTKSFADFSKQFEEISKQAEKNLSEKELEMINEFKEKAKTIKGGDFSSLMELKSIYDQKIKDGI
jgi:DNA anti-recombination protein RmuC